MRLLMLLLAAALALGAEEAEEFRARAIVGGTEVEEGEFPFVVRGNGVGLGSAIIDRDWIVVSAHRNAGERFERDRQLPAWVVGHPDYRGGGSTEPNDIGLLYIPQMEANNLQGFRGGFEVTDDMIVAMATPEEAVRLVAPGSPVTVIGGARRVLRKAEWVVKECGGLGWTGGGPKICVDTLGVNSGTEVGDSSGALLARDGDRWVLVGVTSGSRYVYGIGGRMVSRESIFESVAWHREWIEGVIASRRKLGVNIDVGNQLGPDWSCEVRGFLNVDGSVSFEQQAVPDLRAIRLGAESAEQWFAGLLDVRCEFSGNIP